VTSILILALFLTQGVPASLEQLRSDSNLERRAKAAIEFAATAEKSAEANYSKGEITGVAADLKNMAAAVEIAKEALDQTGKSANKHPGPFKTAELKTQDILVRLGDLEKRMDAEERAVLEGPRNRVQEIHDAWFDGIMSKKK